MDRAELAGCSGQELADAIGQVHAVHMAALGALCELVAAFDEREAWREDGASSMAAWLTMRLGLAWRSSIELVRVSRRLEDLPRLSAVLAEGGMSWDQLAAITHFASPASDAELASDGPSSSAAQLQRVARRHRRQHPQPPTRHVRRRWDLEGGWLRVSACLPAADGAVVDSAIDRLADAAARPEGGWGPLEERAADALVELASTYLGGEADPERTTVVVHVEAAALGDDLAVGEIADGPELAMASVRRMACDGRIEWVMEGPGGQPVLGIGRASRQVPAWLARQVRHRDRGCRFPGCGRTRWTDCHHLVHWAQGGRTDADNLVRLCGFHHRLVHEGGWRVSGSPDGELCFVRPDGRPLSTRPPPLRASVAARVGYGRVR